MSDETRMIELTQGKHTIIDDADLDLVTAYKWYAHKDRNTFYAVTHIGPGKSGKLIRMHRLILGLTDPKVETDHRDGDGLNNRRENLRACTTGENQRNTAKHSDNTSGHKGVSWHNGRKEWRAQIRYNGKTIYLGRFDDPVEASLVYERKAEQLHGEFYHNPGMADSQF